MPTIADITLGKSLGSKPANDISVLRNTGQQATK
jgi:hypothetical protein